MESWRLTKKGTACRKVNKNLKKNFFFIKKSRKTKNFISQNTTHHSTTHRKNYFDVDEYLLSNQIFVQHFSTLAAHVASNMNQPDRQS